MENLSADSRIGLVGESEDVFGLVPGKLLEDECVVGGGCLNGMHGRFYDRNLQANGSHAEKVGCRCENNGLVNPLENCETSLRLMAASGSPRNCHKLDDQDDYRSSSVEGVMEEQSSGLSAMLTDTRDQIVSSAGSEMPACITSMNGLPRNGIDHIKHDNVASLESVVTEEKTVDLGGIETDGHKQELLSRDSEILSQIMPMTSLTSNFVQQNDQEDDQIICPSMKVVIEKSDDLAMRSLELVPASRSFDDQKDTKPVSSLSEARAMENVLFARVGTVMNSQILSSLNGEICSEPVPFSGLLRDSPQQNELDIKSFGGMAMERAACVEGGVSARIEADICNQISLHSGEMPLKLLRTGDLMSSCVLQNSQKNDSSVYAERIPRDTETKSDDDICIQELPMQACHVTMPDFPLADSASNSCQNDLGVDKSVDGPSKESVSDTKAENCSQILFTEGNDNDPKEHLFETSMNNFVEKSVSSQSCQAFGVDETGSSKGFHVSRSFGEDAFGAVNSSSTVDCSCKTENDQKDLTRTDCVSETKCPDVASSSSQRSGRLRKSSRKNQMKRSARKCRNMAKVPDLDGRIEIFFRPVRKKRSCLPKPARSSSWGLMGNIMQIFKPMNGLVLNPIQNLESRKARVRRCRKRENNRTGGTSQRSSAKCSSSTGCIRLKVIVGKEVGQSSLNIMIPEVISTQGSADAVISDCGAESYQGTNSKIPNLTNAVEDKVGEGTAENLFQSFDNKLDNGRTCPNVSAVDVHPSNEDLEVTVFSKNSNKNATEDYLGVSSHKEEEDRVLGIAKGYIDPETSPDSEVINSVPDCQIDARCQGDFADAILTSNFFVARGDVSSNKKGKKKDRLPHADNCVVKDISSGPATINKVKATKKRGSRQRKGDRFCSETGTSCTIANVSSNSSSSKELCMEKLLFSRENELEGSREALKLENSTGAKLCNGVDTSLGLSEPHNLDNLLPSTKSKGCQLARKSGGVYKGRSKDSDSARNRRSSGCIQRGNEHKSVNKNKLNEKSVCDREDDPEKVLPPGNHVADDNGITNASEHVASVDVVNFNVEKNGITEQNLPEDNAWVRCDDCHKWRRIPVALVDSIGQTNCQWICKNNMDKAFADCSIPQEKSNAAINAELGISDADADTCDALSDNKGLERRHITVSKGYEFTRISANHFLHRSRKRQTIDEIMVCHCKAPADGGLGCGDECLNRMLNIECIKGTCPCGDFCSNQQFQKRNYAKMKWERCGKKGFGLRLEEDISKGKFLVEYVGEVLDMRTYEARQKEYASKGHKHFYFMTLNGSEVIDACAKGNLGRFINHSCDPNCRTEKWVVNGEICIGLFALRDIKKGEEVTFDYNYVRVVGAAAKKCYCGSPQCRGYIGGDPTNTEVIDQVDSDDEFCEPVMLEDEEGGDGFKSTISRTVSSNVVERQVAESISKAEYEADNREMATAKLEVATENYDSVKQSASVISQLQSSFQIIDLKETVPSANQTVGITLEADVTSKSGSVLQQEIPIEETISKTPCSIQRVETSPTTISSKSSSDSIAASKKSKTSTSEMKRVFVKSRFLIKTSHQSDKKGKSVGNTSNVSKVPMTTNKSQVLSIKPKKLVETTCNGHFETVEEKLNELLDAYGGISKRKDATKGYLKLLLLTAASGGTGNGEAIQSNRDLSMIIDALLKTKSRAVLIDIVNKNGLQMLHNIMKQYRRDFKKIPILRKLLKVLEYLAVREILTLEHINRGPPFPGMESFGESILSLTVHDDKQVHQIARSFRDRWIPRHVRKVGYMDRDDGRMEFHRGSNCNRVSASHHHRYDQGVRPTEATGCIMQSKFATPSVDNSIHEGYSAPATGGGSRTRKRKSRWDQPSEGSTTLRSLQHNEHCIESLPEIGKEGLDQGDKTSREDIYCPHCVRNYFQQDEGSSSADDGRQNVPEDVPPGFSSPLQCSLVSSNASTVSDLPQNVCYLKCPVSGVVGHSQRKFISRLPVSYGIPLTVVQQFGSPQAEKVESWVIAPGMPFYPFPPIPPAPYCKKETSPCAVNSVVMNESAEGQQGRHGLAICHLNENNPSTTGNNQPDVDTQGANEQQTLKRPRDFSYDLGRKYFRQQKWNKGLPQIRSKNGLAYTGNDSRGVMCSTDIGIVTNEHGNLRCLQDVSRRVEKADNHCNQQAMPQLNIDF